MSTSTVRIGDREITVRELRDNEYPKLLTVPPFAQHGIPNMPNMRAVVGVDDQGVIVGYWMLFDAVHVEPLWIREDYQGHPGFGRRLWGAVVGILKTLPVPRAFAMIHDEQAAMNVPMGMRLGFRRMPGDLYFIDTTKMRGNGQPVEDTG